MGQPDTSKWDATNRGAGAYSTPGVDTRVAEKPFVPLTGTPVVSFRLTDVDPPAAVYVRPPDALFLKAATLLAAGDTVLFSVRVLRSDGTIVGNDYQLFPTSGGFASSLKVDLPEGYLLSITAQATNAVTRGQTFVRIYLLRSKAAGAQNAAILFGDYITITGQGAFPIGRIADSVEGPGNIRSITGTTPAAGAEINEVVPANTRWRLLAFRYTLTTAVAAANRETSLVIDDGVNPYVNDSAAFTQIASLVFIYSYELGLQRQAALQSNLITLGSPAVILPPGHRIRTLTANIQAADQYSAPQYVVEELLQIQ